MVDRSQEADRRVFSSAEKSVLFRANQSLDGGDVLPGFILPVADFFDHGRQPGDGLNPTRSRDEQRTNRASDASKSTWLAGHAEQADPVFAGSPGVY